MSNKKFYLFAVLFVLILSCYVFAGEVDFSVARDSYSSFETLQAKIIFNIQLAKDLSITNIKLLGLGDANVDLSKRLVKINNTDYYVYFDLPKLNAGLYDFGVYGVFYNKDGVVRRDSFTTKVNVVDRTDNVLSINPAFVLRGVVDYEEAPFTLVVKNSGVNNLDVKISTEGNFLSASSNTFNLVSGASKTINVGTLLYNKLGDFFSGKIKVEYSGLFYEIPVNIKRVITTQPEEARNQTVVNKTFVENVSEVKVEALRLGDLYGNPFNDNITLAFDKSKTVELSLVSDVDMQLHDISVIVGGDAKGIVSLKPASIKVLDSYGIYPINLEIKDLNKNYRGEIIVKAKESKDFIIPLFIIFEKEVVEELNKSSQVINRTVSNVTSGVPSEEENSGFIWLIIILIILMIGLLIYYFYRRNKPKQDEFEQFIESVKRRR